MLSTFTPSFKILDVCVAEPSERITQLKPNCSKCKKCVRQLISLELEGDLLLFRQVFDIDYYFKHKQSLVEKYILVHVLLTAKGNELDVINLAYRKGAIKTLNLHKIRSVSKYSWTLKKFFARKMAREYVNFCQNKMSTQ